MQAEFTMQSITQKLQRFKDISAKLTLCGRFDDALKMCAAGIEMMCASPEKDTPQGAKWLYALETTKAGALMAKKDFEGAKNAYAAALEYIAALPRGIEFSCALDNLAKAFKALGDAQNALACRKASLENLEEFDLASKELVAEKYMLLAGELDACGRCAEAIEIRRKIGR